MQENKISSLLLELSSLLQNEKLSDKETEELNELIIRTRTLKQILNNESLS